MTIVCHTRKFIFLKTRKTAGSSIEIWLAPHLDPERRFYQIGGRQRKAASRSLEALQRTIIANSTGRETCRDTEPDLSAAHAGGGRSPFCR